MKKSLLLIALLISAAGLTYAGEHCCGSKTAHTQEGAEHHEGDAHAAEGAAHEEAAK